MAPASAGDRQVTFDITTAGGKNVSIAPSICFENMLPQIIGGHVRALLQQKKSPDLLSGNVTNDGWFRGSSILDIHLANAIMTAVENRRPMLVAANTGVFRMDRRGRPQNRRDQTAQFRFDYRQANLGQPLGAMAIDRRLACPDSRSCLHHITSRNKQAIRSENGW